MTNEYRVELSGDAKSDILSIYDYIKDSLMNPSAAARFIEDTDNAVTSLETFPYSHMVRPGSRLSGGLEKRQYFYRKSYCLFYVVKEEFRLVRIIKVSYSAKDLDKD